MRMWELWGTPLPMPSEEDGVGWRGFVSPWTLARHEAPHWGWPRFQDWMRYHHQLRQLASDPVVPPPKPRARCCPD